MHYCCIIVLYNINFKSSDTYNSVIDSYEFKNQQITVVLVDNSTSDYCNESSSELKNHIYISMNGNKGISKAYNAALDTLKELELLDNNLVILLDDDTKLNQEYFQSIKDSYAPNIDIYLPIVYDEIGILSPSIMGLRCKRCKKISQITKENICGINSGMVVKGKIFNSYRYDERIFLDYVDHQFIRDMKTSNKNIIILNAKLYQHFSSNNDNYQQTMNRFQIMKKDLKIFYSRNFVEKVIYYYVINRRRIGIFLKFNIVASLGKRGGRL